MLITWEPKDIKPGVRYSKPGISEVLMIGYRPDLDSVHHFVAVSLADGLVTPACTAKGMAESLNANEYTPIELIPGRR